MDPETLPRTESQLESRVRLPVDALGGDHAPDGVVARAVDRAANHPDPDVNLGGEHPAQAVRRKRDASINVCMRLIKEGKADAVVTAGHTGAGVASAILNLGRLKNVDRPALAVQLVTDKGPMVFLDIGATTDSTGNN